MCGCSRQHAAWCVACLGSVGGSPVLQLAEWREVHPRPDLRVLLPLRLIPLFLLFFCFPSSCCLVLTCRTLRLVLVACLLSFVRAPHRTLALPLRPRPPLCLAFPCAKPNCQPAAVFDLAMSARAARCRRRRRRRRCRWCRLAASHAISLHIMCLPSERLLAVHAFPSSHLDLIHTNKRPGPMRPIHCCRHLSTNPALLHAIFPLPTAIYCYRFLAMSFQPSALPSV